MKFAHISDSHLGSWRQPELQFLNMQSFITAIDTCINENVEFVLFAGDLFDSAFPQIEILKETFRQFRKLKESGIKSYVIAGSHDYSVSGKTFLDVLEKAGLCEICKYEEDDEKKVIILKPIIHKTYHIYGYPGKKSGLELEDLRKVRIMEPYKSYFRILMLHTTLKEVTEGLDIDSIDISELPHADYYALGHIHVKFEKDLKGKFVVYGGPTFPNNFKELEDLKYGRFYIIEINGYTKIKEKQIKLKEVELIEIELNNSLNGTEKILSELKKRELRDKIVLLKIYGKLKEGKISDIKFQEIEEYLKKEGAYSFLKNTSKLEISSKEINVEVSEMEKIEEVIFEKYEKENPSALNKFIFPLMESLNIEKNDGETLNTFQSRLLSEVTKVLDLDLQ